jgi:hypothetical protein
VLAGLKRNLSGGLALLALRREWPPRFARGFDQLLLLLGLNLALWATLDALHAEAHAQLALDGLFGWACYLLLALGACALIARVEDRAADTRALLIPALAVSPPVLAVLWVASETRSAGAHPLAALAVTLLYLAALAVRVLGAAYGPVRRRTVLVALTLLLASPWALGLLNLDTRLWVAAEPEATGEAEDSDQAEALFYDQPAQILAAVERVEPAARGETGVYFVGFAGDGSQAVFRREVLYAREIFGERFGSGERSVLLVNDVEDRDSYPLASVSGLEQTLKALAARMRTEEDVLVLFLTSHGSEDGLEVENGSLPLAQLGPADLRQALDDSGIRWRVLVVSACYAGVFLDELRGDTTLIITAADAAHASFGCDDDRELTWFGEAFLRDSLSSSGSLEEAFRRAAALIARREEAGHEVHSNPQLYVGALMRTKLAQVPLAPPARDGRALSVSR